MFTRLDEAIKSVIASIQKETGKQDVFMVDPVFGKQIIFSILFCPLFFYTMNNDKVCTDTILSIQIPKLFIGDCIFDNFASLANFIVVRGGGGGGGRIHGLIISNDFSQFCSLNSLKYFQSSYGVFFF